MANKKHVTFGGLGQHEFYMPTTGRGHENRRDRKKASFILKAPAIVVKSEISALGQLSV